MRSSLSRVATIVVGLLVVACTSATSPATATLLSDGTVLVAGGSGDGTLAPAELYHLGSGF